MQYKDKRRKITVKKCFVLYKEVIDVFHNKSYIPAIENLSLHLAHVRIVGSMEYGKTTNKYFNRSSLKND